MAVEPQLKTLEGRMDRHEKRLDEHIEKATEWMARISEGQVSLSSVVEKHIDSMQSLAIEGRAHLELAKEGVRRTTFRVMLFAACAAGGSFFIAFVYLVAKIIEILAAKGLLS